MLMYGDLHNRQSCLKNKSYRISIYWHLNYKDCVQSVTAIKKSKLGIWRQIFFIPFFIPAADCFLRLSF